MMMVGSHVFFITSCGQMFYHTLTRAERYLSWFTPSPSYTRQRAAGSKSATACNNDDKQLTGGHVVSDKGRSEHTQFLYVTSFTKLLLPSALTVAFSDMAINSPSSVFHNPAFIFTAFSATNILLLLPLCVLVLYLGCQKWRSASVASHSDVFTYHMVAMEVFGIFGCGLYCCGACVDVPWLMMVGVYFFSVTSKGQIFFHILTCVERHLAVVHPIIYLGLRNRGRVRIRNVTIGCVWLFFLGSFGLTSLASNFSTIPSFLLSVVSIAVVSFCSLSVLRALICPGPGEGGGDGERVDQSKIRAFHIITTIMGTLLLRFGGHLLILLIYSFSEVSENIRCGALVSGVWFNLPSSLVLPLLFLHRVGKLVFCKNNTESGQSSE
ncbi:uncharacterized protein AKAME5_002481600 [Lates japonicus]|uniref:Uncharacterized protein n=1 Tax=Lates japonicus TaxID=270547 RepID=A0AAD3NLZ5_LATJO|nr:uncharacterized protein AKAME5_002481600 [Lates japonicus]